MDDDLFDAVEALEVTPAQQGHEEGAEAGRQQGFVEGKHAGLQVGIELGMEVSARGREREVEGRQERGEKEVERERVCVCEYTHTHTHPLLPPSIHALFSLPPPTHRLVSTSLLWSSGQSCNQKWHRNNGACACPSSPSLLPSSRLMFQHKHVLKSCLLVHQHQPGFIVNSTN